MKATTTGHETRQIANVKVLFVLPNVAIGGVERVRLTLIEHLVERNIECRLVLRRRRGELIERARALVPVDELAPQGIHQFVPALVKVIRRERPTHVVTAFSDVGFLGWLALRLAGSQAKWVHSVHNTHGAVGSRRGIWGRFRYRLENRMGGFAYHHADAIVTVSDGVRQEILDWYRVPSSRVTTIYNPVVPDNELLVAPRSRPSNSTLCRIVAIGRLVRQKGFDVLVRAMADVPGSWRLDIWGEGPERHELEALIEGQGLQDKVRLRGYTSQPLKMMRQADIYVMASRHEGLPATLIEALACGCQLVATDCPHGPREILQEGALGQLVSPDDPHALAGAIEHVMDGRSRVNPEDLLRRAGDFSRSTCCAQWEALLRSL